MQNRLQSRLGFLMLAAGCAVGLGNVWRFPFVVGKNGGAAFVLVYLVFLALLGFPLLTAELALGRGSGDGIAGAFKKLAKSGNKWWGCLGSAIFLGNVLLMIYYTTVAGWLESFMVSYLTTGSGRNFGALVSNAPVVSGYMLAAVLISTFVCALGLNRGVERITKWMMLVLLALISVMAIKSLMLPGAMEGVKFYLYPDWKPLLNNPRGVLFDAMAQAFFTLSVGVGAMTIFGSYIGRSHSLATESLMIIVIDSFVAFMAGLVIFPASVAFGVDVKSGPGLIFEALPNVFAAMQGGGFWGMVFFLFLSLAALTTIIAVFECIIAGFEYLFKLSRLKAVFLTGLVVSLLSLPTAIFEPVLGVEDFIFSQFWLPIGGLAMCALISSKRGWTFENFLNEVNCGLGLELPVYSRYLYGYFIPLLVLLILIGGVL